MSSRLSLVVCLLALAVLACLSVAAVRASSSQDDMVMAHLVDNLEDEIPMAMVETDADADAEADAETESEVEAEAETEVDAGVDTEAESQVEANCPGSCLAANAACSGSWLHGVCPGSSVCCVPKPASKCPGSCVAATSTCGGTWLHGVCPGADVCCVPSNGASSTTPSTPATPTGSEPWAAPAGEITIPSRSQNHGVDLWQAASVADLKCLLAAGYKQLILRGGRTDCRLDKQMISNLKNAYSAGFELVDVYIFPGYKCSVPPATQVNQVLNALKGYKFGVLWLDLEMNSHGKSGWTGSLWDQPTSQNTNKVRTTYAQQRAWIDTFVKTAIDAIGASRVGIYTNFYGWQAVQGTDYQVAKYNNLRLWDAIYDKVGTTAKIDPLKEKFGGWTQGAIKQYQADKTVCKLDVDLNIYD